MVNIKCELCGSNEFTKQDDFFVCQHCGCKYTIEQAKKLIIDGVVNVEGKVEINTSEKIKNLYTIARRSRDNNDWDAAKRYYDLVLQEDPLSWEAIFYLAYFDAYYCKNGELQYKASKMCNCITSVCDLINESKMSLKEKFDAYVMLSNSVLLISRGLQERARNFRNSMIGIKAISPTMLLGAGKDQQTYYDTVVPMINCIYNFANGIEKVIDQFGEFPQLRELMVSFWQLANQDLKELFGRSLSDHNKQIINGYNEKILRHTPEEQKYNVSQQLQGYEVSTRSTGGSSKVGLVFGIIGLAFGAFCLLFAFIFMCVAVEDFELGPVAFMFGVYAICPLVFSIISLKKGSKKGLAIPGLICSCAAIFFGFIGLILSIA